MGKSMQDAIIECGFAPSTLELFLQRDATGFESFGVIDCRQCGSVKPNAMERLIEALSVMLLLLSFTVLASAAPSMSTTRPLRRGGIPGDEGINGFSTHTPPEELRFIPRRTPKGIPPPPTWSPTY